MPSSPHRKAPGLAGVLALPGGKGGGGETACCKKTAGEEPECCLPTEKQGTKGQHEDRLHIWR